LHVEQVGHGGSFSIDDPASGICGPAAPKTVDASSGDIHKRHSIRVCRQGKDRIGSDQTQTPIGELVTLYRPLRIRRTQNRPSIPRLQAARKPMGREAKRSRPVAMWC
jgi:hypothetical protein